MGWLILLSLTALGPALPSAWSQQPQHATSVTRGGLEGAPKRFGIGGIRPPGLRLSEEECAPGGHVAWVGNLVGGELPGGARSEVCGAALVPQGTGQVLVSMSMTLYFGSYCQQNPGHPRCLLDYSVSLTASGTPVYSAAATVGPGSVGTWTCAAEGGRCWTTVDQVIDIAAHTSEGPAELTLLLVLEGQDYSPIAVLDVLAVAGIMPSIPEITFDFAEGHSEGLTLRIDEDTEINKPEWKWQLKDKKPTIEAYDGDTSAPAAFLAGNRLKAKAMFSLPWASAEVKGITVLPDGSPSPYGELTVQTVQFDESYEPIEVEFESENTASEVAAADISIRWQLVSYHLPESEDYPEGETRVIPGTYIFQTTHHRIYTVYKQPVAPMEVPWAKVLELSSAMMAGMTSLTNEETAVQQIADHIFYSRWTGYTTRFFEPRRAYQYNPAKTVSCGSQSQQFLRLTHLLNSLALEDEDKVEIQCNDTSNFSAVLAASQGITALPSYIRDSRPPPPGSPPELPWRYLSPTALYSPAGGSPPEESLCKISVFLFHQVASYSSLYDTSARAATEEMQSCKPGDNFFGLGPSAYMTAVFPAQPANYTTITRPPVGITKQCGQ